MSKYSRAPWRTHLINETVVVSADAEIVAQIEGDYNNDAERMTADARLIAAAPQLLEALEKCTNKLEKAMVLTGTDAEFAAIAVQEYRAAIAAAKGDA